MAEVSDARHSGSDKPFYKMGYRKTGNFDKLSSTHPVGHLQLMQKRFCDLTAICQICKVSSFRVHHITPQQNTI